MESQITPVRMSIGLCAWNEADRLPRTLESLSRQDCFRCASSVFSEIEVVVVANACTDNTVEIAEEHLSKLVSRSAGVAISTRVSVTESKGKANAWNMFVHELSDPRSDFLISMDCDIEFLHPNVIARLVDSLQRNQVAHISRPVCRKSTELRQSKSLVDRIALAATRQQQAAKWYVPLPGAIYCGRAVAIRSVWQPLGMLGDDGHLRDMVVTNNWRCPKNRKDERIILVEDVEIAFEAHSGFRDILRHQVRARIGLACRAILHEFLDRVVGEEDASQLVARLNKENPDWYKKVIYDGLNQSSWWVLPWSMFPWKRIRELGRLSLGVRVRAFPVALLGDLSDFVADLRANHHFRRKIALGVW